MTSRRQVAAPHAHEQPRPARQPSLWSRGGFVVRLKTVLAAGVAAMYVVLLEASFVASPEGAVVASLVGLAVAVGGCAWAYDGGRASARNAAAGLDSGWPRAQDAGWWIFLPAFLFVPLVTHYASGRYTDGIHLTFGDRAPELVSLAQTIGWAVMAVVVVGGPLAWLWGRLRPPTA